VRRKVSTGTTVVVADGEGAKAAAKVAAAAEVSSGAAKEVAADKAAELTLEEIEAIADFASTSAVEAERVRAQLWAPYSGGSLRLAALPL
jgi:hypothetical protein